MQKIYIRNNGPVKEFEMDIQNFNLLIGEQATGKSTIAKSVYFFRIIKTSIIDYLTQVCDTKTYKNEFQDEVRFDKAIRRDLKDIFIKLFGYSWDLNPEFEMWYEYATDISIRVALHDGDRPNKKLISVNYSKVLYDKIEALRKEIIEIYYNDTRSMLSLALTSERRKRNHEMIIQRVNEIFADNKETYFIPAGRSLLTVMSSNRAMMNSATNLDLITEQFMMLIDSIRNGFERGVKMAHQYYPVEQRSFDVNDIAEFIIHMQKGEYFSKKGKEYLQIPEDSEHMVAINFASSGQQEILWVLNFLYVLLLKQEKAFVIIEEPEAHIYPALQKELMEFIAMYTNLQDNSVFITTHSPYVLTAVNNLYYAGVLAQEGHGKAVHQVVPKRKMISAGQLSAYKLLSRQEKGKELNYLPLFEDSGREIRTAMLDEVSAQINEVYTALYNIELDGE
ncbi:MAG: AAA family ATPase [Lachnospiraceae bacterium]|nr:AAA family ATPase [Lachnospiraceae bacterium]